MSDTYSIDESTKSDITREFRCSKCNYRTNRMSRFREHVAFSRTLCLPKDRELTELDLIAYDKKKAMIIKQDVYNIITDELITSDASDTLNIEQWNNIYTRLKKLTTKLRIYIQYDDNPFMSQDEYDSFVENVVNQMNKYKPTIKTEKS